MRQVDPGSTPSPLQRRWTLKNFQSSLQMWPAATGQKTAPWFSCRQNAGKSTAELWQDTNQLPTSPAAGLFQTGTQQSWIWKELRRQPCATPPSKRKRNPNYMVDSCNTLRWPPTHFSHQASSDASRKQHPSLGLLYPSFVVSKNLRIREKKCSYFSKSLGTLSNVPHVHILKHVHVP